MESKQAWVYWGVVAAAALLLLVGIGSFALGDPDEARFARTSVEMMRSGDYVVPTFEGVPRLVKPPAVHWVQTSLFRMLGPSEGAARLHAALATLGSLFLLGAVARRRFGDEGAIWAGAIFATMPLVLAVGRIGTLDALLAVHVFAAIALDMTSPGKLGGAKGAALGAILGLAFLVKGPVGVAVPLVAILAGRTAAGREVVPGLRTTLIATAAWCAVVLPWGLAFIDRIGVAGVTGLIRSELLQRAVEGTAHVEPPWYYAPVLAIGALPWAGTMFVGIVRAIGRRRDADAQTGVYVTAALLAGLGLFSISKGKLPNYILPLMPLAALVTTWEIGQELSHPRRRRAGMILTATILVALAVGLGGAAALKLEAEARGAAYGGAIAFALAAAVAVYGLLRLRPRLVYGAAAAATAAFLLAAVVGLAPALSEKRSARGLTETVRELHDATRPIVSVGMHVPSLTWYLDRVPEQLPVDGVAERLAKGDHALFVFDVDDLKSVPRDVRDGMREVGRSGKYRVLESPAP